MKIYEQQISELFTSAINNHYIEDNEKDANYFIETYGDKFIGRNKDNVKHKLKLYKEYLDKEK